VIEVRGERHEAASAAWIARGALIGLAAGFVAYGFAWAAECSAVFPTGRCSVAKSAPIWAPLVGGILGYVGTRRSVEEIHYRRA